MKYGKVRRALAVALLLSMLFLCLAAPLGHCHVCSGADCPLCRMLHAATLLFTAISVGGLRLAPQASSPRPAVSPAEALPGTPVLLGVRLNN